MFKTNEYFDGKVQSIAFQGKDKPATVGVMAAGEYVFNTAEKEKMTVISGELGIQLKGETEVITYTAGQSFEVAENRGKISWQSSVCSYQLKTKTA
jgi:uncharacterized protein YaiE (UPF0345 family)